LYNLYTNIHIRALIGVPQEKWATLYTLFWKYGPIPRLLFEKFLPPSEYGTENAEMNLQANISAYDSILLLQNSHGLT